MSIPSSGSSTARSASTTSSFVGTESSLWNGGALAPERRVQRSPAIEDRGAESARVGNSVIDRCGLTQQPHFLAALAREEVNPVDEPHPVAAGAHHERVSPRRVGKEADAAEQVAVRDAGRR